MRWLLGKHRTKPRYELITDSNDNWAVRCNYGTYEGCLLSFNPLTTSAFYKQLLNLDSCWTTYPKAFIAYSRLMA